MTKRLLPGCLFACALAAARLAPAVTPAPAAPPKVADLAFLSGSWETEQGNARVDEQWTCPGPGAMFGMGRTVTKEKTLFFEFLRIEERPDGVFYVAQPKGRPPTDFRLVEHDAGSVVFENLAHDFPKRVRYAKGPADTLVARVEGDASSTEKAEEYRYRRVTGACR